MPKNSKSQIEEDEQRVLSELTKDSRKSPHEIAKICGFSRQKVWRIIKKLEEENVIWGYTAIVNDEKQNMRGYILLLKRTNLPLSKEMIDKVVGAELEKTVDKMGIEIKCSSYLNGVYDWMILFTAQNLGQAKKFCEVLNKIFIGHVAELDLLEEIFSNKKFGISNPQREKVREFFNL